MRDLVPYRTSDGQVGLWDDAPNEDPDYIRFYPNQGVGSFLFGGVAYQLDENVKKVYEGTLSSFDVEDCAGVEKVGAYVVSAGGVTNYPSLTLSEGTFSLCDGNVQECVTPSLTLRGGMTLAIDMSEVGCDRFSPQALDLSGASEESPIVVKVIPLGPVGTDGHVFIDKGLSPGDAEKFKADSAGLSVTFSVSDGALLVSTEGLAIPETAEWTNASGNGDVADPSNWICRDSAGEPIADALPQNITYVTVSGDCTFNCPKGSDFSCAEILFDNVRILADSDWRGLASPLRGGVDLNGHRLSISTFSNNTCTFTDTQPTGGVLHVDIPAGVSEINVTSAFSGTLKVEKDGQGTFTAGRPNQTYSGGTDVAAGTLVVGGFGTSRYCGAANTDLTVRSGATFEMDGWGNHQDYVFMMDGGTLKSSVGNRSGVTAWIKEMVLTADSYIYLVPDANCGFVAGVGTATLEMNGHTLFVDGLAYLHAPNTVVKGGGKMSFIGGWFLPGVDPGLSSYEFDGGTTVIEMGEAAQMYCIGTRPVVFYDYISHYVANPYGNVYNKGDNAIQVVHLLRPGKLWHSANLLDGATLDLSESEGVWNSTCSFANGSEGGEKGVVTFADGAKITVDLGTRDLKNNTKVIGWTESAKPADSVKFKCKTHSLVRKDDGVYVGSVGLILFVQ